MRWRFDVSVMITNAVNSDEPGLATSRNESVAECPSTSYPVINRRCSRALRAWHRRASSYR